MIFNHDKIYAKVWKVTPSEKYLDLQISTSEKDKDGNYINSTWFPRCIGHAFNTLNGNLKEGDRITITLSKFSNEKYTAKDGTIKSAFKFLVLEATIEESSDSETKKTAATAPDNAQTDNKEDCPW